MNIVARTSNGFYSRELLRGLISTSRRQLITSHANARQTVQFSRRFSIIKSLLGASDCFKYNSIDRSLSIQHIAPLSTMKDGGTIENKCPKESRFKTSYGHISALEWGQSDAPHKILCLHGYLDNAGSFEPIIPLILDHNDNRNKYHIISIDEPGVGLSSHIPPGQIYSQFTTLIEMRRITQKLNWDKFTLLAHSFGSHLSFMYSCVYPDQVESLISIDLSYPITRQVHNWNLTIANSIEDHLRYEYHLEDDPTTNILASVYSETDAIKRLMDGHSASLTKKSAEVLMKRGTKKQRWGYTFTRDVRLRHLSAEIRPDDDLMLQYLSEAFHPNLFIVRASRSIYRGPEEVRSKYYKLFQKNCPIFLDLELEGTHHLHMNTPETVAPHINKFLDHIRAISKSGVTINKPNL